jgi:hypothetical protein
MRLTIDTTELLHEHDDTRSESGPTITGDSEQFLDPPSLAINKLVFHLELLVNV